jgi:hypothetical protein
MTVPDLPMALDDAAPEAAAVEPQGWTRRARGLPRHSAARCLARWAIAPPRCDGGEA